MTKRLHRSILAALLGTSAVLGATPASAQYVNLTPTVVDDPTPQANPMDQSQINEPIPFEKPSLFRPFTDVLGDFRRLPSVSNAEWLVAGLAAAASTHQVDRQVTSDFAGTRNQLFRPGAIVGGTPFELGAAFATYAIGRSLNKPGAMSLGSDLIRAEIMAEVLTVGIKEGTRRTRPDGTSMSFPSGHTSSAFATATVIQEHFGWKWGVPAYAVASYVAASRVEMKKHYLSDVAFGAAVGIISAHTVTIGNKHKFSLTPITSTDGTGIGAGLTLVGNK
jgi:PAP2 superfamily protein